MAPLVVLTHHAVVYDIPTAAAPEKAMANSKNVRLSDGLQTMIRTRRDGFVARKPHKFSAKFADVQRSTRREKTTKTGMVSKLL